MSRSSKTWTVEWIDGITRTYRGVAQVADGVLTISTEGTPRYGIADEPIIRIPIANLRSWTPA